LNKSRRFFLPYSLNTSTAAEHDFLSSLDDAGTRGRAPIETPPACRRSLTLTWAWSTTSFGRLMADSNATLRPKMHDGGLNFFLKSTIFLKSKDGASKRTATKERSLKPPAAAIVFRCLSVLPEWINPELTKNVFPGEN
jgi:hypothetical protein